MSTLIDLEKGARLSTTQIVQSLLHDIYLKDACTYFHCCNVGLYAGHMIQQMWGTYGFNEDCDEISIKCLLTSALLHDVGKIMIPDEILNKPGPLTHDEFELMKTHTEWSWKILYEVASLCPDRADFFQLCGDVARCHHEYLDETGYSRGLPKTNIQVGSRIITICDIYEALSAQRCYRPAKSHNEAVTLLTEQFKGKVDPCILNDFICMLQRMHA
ncbi:MAG: HD domain-containing protein [Clostridia bacterium]